MFFFCRFFSFGFSIFKNVFLQVFFFFKWVSFFQGMFRFFGSGFVLCFFFAMGFVFFLQLFFQSVFLQWVCVVFFLQ